MRLEQFMSWLEIAKQATSIVNGVVASVKAGREGITRADGSVVPPEEIQRLHAETMAQAGQLGDDFIGDIANRDRT